MRYLGWCITVCYFLIFTSCNSSRERNPALPNEALEQTEYTGLNTNLYAIPSPHQLSLLIRDDCPFFDESIFNNKLDVNKYFTSERKALVMGAMGADLGYMSLYDQKNLTLQYLNQFKGLFKESKFGSYDPTGEFVRFEKNFSNKDSLLSIIAEVFKKEHEQLHHAEQNSLSSLVIAGGWIESFYILNKLYFRTKNSNLFGILLQQRLILDHLIAELKPLYKTSPEYSEIVDHLVEMAYEFEVVDFKYKGNPAVNQDNLTLVKCQYTPLLTGSQLDKINDLSGSLRNNLIY